MPQLDHQHQQHGVLDLIHDTVIPHADAPERFLAGQLQAAGRPGIFGQRQYGRVKSVFEKSFMKTTPRFTLDEGVADCDAKTVISNYAALATGNGFGEELAQVFREPAGRHKDMIELFLGGPLGQAITSNKAAARAFLSRLYRVRTKIATEDDDDADFFSSLGFSHHRRVSRQHNAERICGQCWRMTPSSL